MNRKHSTSLSWIAVTLLPVIGALKLTPVQQLTQRVDLSSESRSTSVALNNAIYKFEQFESTGSDLKEFLESADIQKLYAVIRRWNYIEERLKISMANGNSQQAQQFEDVQHNVASIKALIGQALYRGHDEKMAMNELEYSCPTLWRLKSSWRSIAHDGWLDCYSTLGENYLNKQRTEDAKVIADKLLRSLPWIRSVLKIPETEESSVEVLKAFIALTPDDRKHIALEVKGAWAFAEGIRGSFKLLIDDFMSTESARKRQTILVRAKRVTEEILQQYSTEEFAVPTDIVASLSSINVEMLRVKLFEEIKKETELFLSGMQGFIKSGEEYLKEMKQYDLSSTFKTSFETLTAVLEAGNELSWAQLHASELSEDTSGFRDLREVIQSFESSIEKSKLIRQEELEKAKRQSRTQQNKDSPSSKTSTSSSSSSSSSKYQKAENKFKRSRNTASSSRSSTYNETFDKRQSSKVVEDVTWSAFLLDCLWNFLLSGGVLSLVSVAGGHYLRAANATNKLPNRPSRIYAKPPIAVATRRSNNNISSSFLVPPPKLELSEDVETTPWWLNILEDSKCFWLECYAFLCSVIKYTYAMFFALIGLAKRSIFSKRSSQEFEQELIEEPGNLKRNKPNYTSSQQKKRSGSSSNGESVNHTPEFHPDIPSAGFLYPEANLLATEFVEFDLSLPSNKSSHKSKGSAQSKKKKRSGSIKSPQKTNAKSDKAFVERTESAESHKEETQMAEVTVHAEGELESDHLISESDNDSVGSVPGNNENKSNPSVAIGELTIDPFYYDEEGQDEGEWIEAGARKSTPHPVQKKTSTSVAAPSSPDRNYLALREQRLQKELQRRKAYETAFIKGKLDHAPKGLKKVPGANTSNSVKPVVGLTSSAQTGRNQAMKEMLQLGGSFPDAMSENKETSDKKISYPKTAVKNMSQEEKEQNRKQFMNMMYSLLDRRNKTLTSKKTSSSATDDADGEHSSLTDTENSDDPYHIDRNVVYPPQSFVSSQYNGSSDGVNLPSTQEEMNKFYSIMNAYYYYQATESLIPWNGQQSTSPDLLDSPNQAISERVYSNDHEQELNEPNFIPMAPSLERVRSFEGTVPLFMPPPLIPVSSVASTDSVNTPPAPPLLIPPLNLPPLTTSPTHAATLPFIPDFNGMIPPMLPLGLPPLPFPFNMLPPPPVYRSPDMLFEATQKQIEYYFSVANLQRDIYLRKLMDEEGYVPLSMIARFPRVVYMNVPSDTLLAAVQTSELLDVKLESHRPLSDGSKLSTEELVEATYIRCKDNPTQWVLSNEDQP